MRTFLLLVISVCLLVGCTSRPADPDYSHTKPGYYGGDGSSQEQAIIPVGVEQSAQAWIAQKYPGSMIIGQSLVWPPGKKRYDVYRVRKRDGKIVQVWF